MRALLVLAIIALASSTAMAPHVKPLGADLFWTETNHGAGRPWLDPTCYDDDHTAYGITTGYLAAGQSMTFRSLRVICNVKIQRGYLSFHQRLDAHVRLTDYGGHAVTTDRLVAQNRKTVTRAICNTDLGELHVDLDPTGSEPGEPADYAYWTVTADRAGEYTLQMILNEPWWSGGESSVDYCLNDGAYGP